METKKNSKIELKKVNGPTGEIPFYICKFLEAVGEEQFIKGDKLALEGIDKKSKGLKLLNVEALEITDIERDDYDDYGGLTGKFKIDIRCDKSKYNITAHNGKKKLKKDLLKLLHAKEEKTEDSNFVSQYDILYNGDNHYLMQVILLEMDCKFQYIPDVEVQIVDSPFYDLFWNKIMGRVITEGVCYNHGGVPVELRDSLRNNINDLASKTSVDYHPKSNDIVCDLVHPALYPYIDKVSRFKKGFGKPKSESENDKSDYWGRPYEKSKYQWLPTPFKISSDGHCSIEEYINNLNRNSFPRLYENIERLFEVFLPYFEEVWNYISSVKFYQNEEEGENDDYFNLFCGNNDDDDVDDGDDDNLAEDEGETEEINEADGPSLDKFNPDEKMPDKERFADMIDRKENVLHDRELQVIVKIVDYTLQPQQEYEGVWHAEGMSHENIVMTGIYFLDRDIDLEGGDLKFKRAFANKERYKVLFSVPQERPMVFNRFAYEGFVPLGHFPTEEGYMLVFPNCHIHKIGKLINKASDKTSSRRIIVFFVVNPDRKIISTREIAPQQDIISLTQAKAYRLELMAERKYDKEKLNVRDIELCEH